jgi:hypothetical protein
MLRRTQDLAGHKLGATDGEIGRVKEFYFDDSSWTVRYLVADTGTWLSGKRVLISPHALRGFNEKEGHMDVDLTKEKIEKSPSIAEDRPVSRQYEAEYYKYYGWPAYWYGPALWGPTPYPVYGHGGVPSDTRDHPKETEGDPHLRSTQSVAGYRIQARDRELGHVVDFIVDDQNWAIRYVVVDTRNWWPGKKVLIAPAWIRNISWEKSAVEVDLESEHIKNAPEYSGDPITREYESKLFNHYKREAYWDKEQARAEYT